MHWEQSQRGSYKMEKFARLELNVAAVCSRRTVVYRPARKTCLGIKRSQHLANAAREIPAANIASAKRYVKRVSRQVPVTAEEAARTLPEIGDDNDIGLVISRPGFRSMLPTRPCRWMLRGLCSRNSPRSPAHGTCGSKRS